jgi:predicted enzyme related to lactoylglutathione lyase
VELRAVKVLVDVEDVTGAARFYSEVLGMQITYDSADWGELEFGTAAIGLHPGGDASKETWTPLSFTVDSLDELGESVLAAGGTIVEPPYDPGEGPFRLATYADPENNRFMGRQDL